MAVEPLARGEVSLTRLFPSVRLLEGVRVSLQFKLLYLAALGLVLLGAGWAGLDRLFPEAPKLTERLVAPPAQVRSFSLESYPPRALYRLSEPARVVIGPFVEVFSRRTHRGSWVHAFLGGVWAMLVWGTIGGAIARIATLRVAAGVRLGMRRSLEFAIRKLVPLVGGPLTPLIGVGLFAAGCALFGLLYQLPTVGGPVVAGALFVLPLIGGLVMGTILIGIAAGWPLVHAAVAAEAEDGFDALSRSYAYVFQRPGRYAFYTAIVWVAGIAGIAFVDLFSRLVVHLAEWGVSFTAPDEVQATLNAGRAGLETYAGTFQGLWLMLVELLVHGWAYAYFWTSASLIYLLLRQEVDGTDFHQVILPAVREIPAATAPDPSDAKLSSPVVTEP